MADIFSVLAVTHRRIRRERGLTQAQLAARAGVSRSAVERLEAGACAHPETVRALERALDAPGELVPLRDELYRRRARLQQRRLRYRATRAAQILSVGSAFLLELVGDVF